MARIPVLFSNQAGLGRNDVAVAVNQGLNQSFLARQFAWWSMGVVKNQKPLTLNGVANKRPVHNTVKSVGSTTVKSVGSTTASLGRG